MKSHKLSLRLCTLLLLLGIIVCSTVFAHETRLDKTKSPYFIVKSLEGEEALLPLKSTNVEVNISGVIADVNVKQVYTNKGKSTVEAIYVFPASTKAAVYNMVMKVDDREIRAVIEEKGKARKMYDKAKKKGKATSLLEEERPNVFKMNVANITPGAIVEIDLSYTELLVPTDKVYEFVYPTLVGPRYVGKAGQKESDSEDWVGNPYLKDGNVSTSTLNIEVNLFASMPIQQMNSTTHRAKVDYLNESNGRVTLQEPHGGNRDFMMQYKLAGEAIESGILTYQDSSGENYFLAMVQPPERTMPEEIPPREYVFIIDVSGSMFGFPLDISKKVIQDVFKQLISSDLFNIVFFAGGSDVYSQEPVQASPANIEAALQYMNSINGSGGTELLGALKTALSLNSNTNYARSFVILTDGYVTVEKETFDFIRNNLGQANFFSFGIGSSVNRFIIEGMARVGYGEAFVANTQTKSKNVANKFVQYISSPVLTNITYQFEGIQAYDVLPQQMPDLFADRPLVIAGKYKGETKGKLVIKGLSGTSSYEQVIDLSNSNKVSGQALKNLWARKKIKLLSDYNNIGRQKNEKAEIIALSKQYNLLTEFTSFIAIDDKVVNLSGKSQSIKQPIPSPKGVSNAAITGELLIVDDDIEIDFCESESYEELDFELVLEEEEEEVIPFFILEEAPIFPGGIEALKKFIATNIKYPLSASECGVQGTVYVSFTIKIDGSIENIKVVRGVIPVLDEEAIRILKTMPKWKPGKQRGKVVPVSYIVPVKFVIE